MQFSATQRAALLDLARDVIRRTLIGLPPLSAPVNDPELRQPAGCFVSLHSHSGKLRGCVGRIDATQPLAIAVATAAESVLKDPRFAGNRVGLEELPNIELELSVLSPLIPVKHVLEFDLLNDGIFLTIGNRGGCFLPQVARQTGWTREQLLERLCTEKMGLAANAWRDPQARMSIFKTIVIGPEPFIVAAAEPVSDSLRGINT
jgi:AmmeMemoRadiSam system protein A